MPGDKAGGNRAKLARLEKQAEQAAIVSEPLIVIGQYVNEDGTTEEAWRLVIENPTPDLLAMDGETIQLKWPEDEKE